MEPLLTFLSSGSCQAPVHQACQVCPKLVLVPGYTRVVGPGESFVMDAVPEQGRRGEGRNKLEAKASRT